MSDAIVLLLQGSATAFCASLDGRAPPLNVQPQRIFNQERRMYLGREASDQHFFQGAQLIFSLHACENLLL
jgi:hypothetical protein